MTINNDHCALDCVCSRTGKRWTAMLECRGQAWVFVHHYLPMEVKQSMVQQKRERLLERLQELSSKTTLSLQPPPQHETIPSIRDEALDTSEISHFGFDCPYCHETTPLMCCVCHKVSCKGDIDSANRTYCTLCGSTLQFGMTEERGAQHFTVEIQSATFVDRIRQMPGNTSKALPGKVES